MASSATLEARLAARQAQLAIAEATYTSLLAKVNKSYTFASGEGSQSTTKQSLAELKAQIDALASEIDQIECRLYGGGVVRFSSSRWK
jgi:uncharacterized protein involved in exopolysaccharide biosynthesis